MATTLGDGSFSSAMIAMTVRNARAGGRLPGLSTFFTWAIATLLVVNLIGVAATIVVLRRHPELVRWPPNPLRPNRARWSITGSALALTSVVGLIVVATGGDALWWAALLAGFTGQWVFLMPARRTGQRGSLATNAPPSTT